jgi:TolA-binding protein
MSLGELGKTQDACTAFSELLKKFPGADTDIVDQAHREQARFGCS